MKKIIHTEHAPQPIGPYNQAVLIHNTLYTSGQIAMDVQTGELIISDIQKETALVMSHLKAILQAAGMTFDNVVKSSIFLNDMKNFSQVNEVYAQHFHPDTAPARETVEVANLPKYVNVEISMIAVR